MSITQVVWIIGIAVLIPGILAVTACIRSSQISRCLRQASRENARLRVAMSKGSILEALREDAE